MKLHHTNRAVIALAIAVGIALSASCKMKMQQSHREMEDIVAAKDLTKDQKLAAVSAYFEREPYWLGVLYCLEKIDKSRTCEIAVARFRNPRTSRLHKYQLGKYLLRAQTPNLDRKPDDPEGFITEYRSFLIDAIMNGGKEEFCVAKLGTETAVGEYAGIGGGINRPDGILFSDVADKQVIPVLVECLSAPDHVYPEKQGCVRRGKPGDATGRNTQRQGIPLALARLNATEAITKLRHILLTHHDYYLRYNSAYALSVIMPIQEVTHLEEQLLEASPSQLFTLPNGKRTLKHFLFPIGKGLLERGVDDGIRFMSYEYAYNSDDTSLLGVLHMAEERVALLKNVKSAKVEPFYSEVLTHQALRAIFLFNAKDLSYYGDEPNFDKITGKVEMRNMPEKGLLENDKRITALYSCILDWLKLNGINGCDQQIEAIGLKTESAEVRQLSHKFLDRDGR
jgi:hypothetical protein